MSNVLNEELEVLFGTLEEEVREDLSKLVRLCLYEHNKKITGEKLVIIVNDGMMISKTELITDCIYEEHKSSSRLIWVTSKSGRIHGCWL